MKPTQNSKQIAEARYDPLNEMLHVIFQDGLTSDATLADRRSHLCEPWRPSNLAGPRPHVTNVQSSTSKVSYQGYAFMTTFEFLRREPDIRDYKKGQTVFKQGDPGSDCMFGVIEGAIDIQIGAETLERVRPTHVFGEMALIDQRPRSATAIAAVDSRIAVINKKRFLHLVEGTPHFALSMMQVITERLRRASVP